MQFHSSYRCAETSELKLFLMGMHVYNTQILERERDSTLNMDVSWMT